MAMTRADLNEAARLWFEHRGNKVLSTTKVDGTLGGVQAFAFIVKNKKKQIIKFLVLQHWCWFDPWDFDKDREATPFILPRNDASVPDANRDDPYAVLCFNNSRTYAIYAGSDIWNDATILESGRRMIHSEDLKCLPVPYRLWALDNLPEWLQRGWPNQFEGKTGETRKPDTWQFHPSWTEDVLKVAEPFKALPLVVDDIPLEGWRRREWYEHWLDHHEDDSLPWAEIE